MNKKNYYIIHRDNNDKIKRRKKPFFPGSLVPGIQSLQIWKTDNRDKKLYLEHVLKKPWRYKRPS